MNLRLIWDSKKLKEVDEAKAEYRKYRAQGYEIQKPDGTIIDRFMPYLEELIVKAKKICNLHVMKILNDKGDERLVWDKENGKQAKEAKVKFEELLGKKYMAFSVDTQGNKNRKIEEFDVDAEEILMIPPTSAG
jgi:chlorite dismutase